MLFPSSLSAENSVSPLFLIVSQDDDASAKTAEEVVGLFKEQNLSHHARSVQIYSLWNG